jgi:pilus assembly protein CpaC
MKRTLATAAVLAFTFLVAVTPTQASTQVVIETTGDQHAGEFVVPINKSQVLKVDRPVTDLLVGNTEIADVQPLTDRSIYVLGKQIGSTSLTIYGKDNSLIAVVDLVVGFDHQELKSKLHEMLPNEDIEVRPMGGSITLSGTVSSSAQLNRAIEIAGRYIGDPHLVSNLLTVNGSQQVMLAVRFAEVSRNLSKNIGINTQVVGDDFSVATGLGIAFDSFLRATGSFTAGEVAVDAALDALEEKSLVKTLAEPNLIALSGDTANFLAGGEFPIPVAQDEDAITVEFKEFGVSLAFTPTVLGDGLINVVVEPEVSRIDPTFAQVVQGLSVPGLSTRRAKTTIELRDGQSFAIAGLLQDDFDDTVEQVPGLGDVPILGALLRSTSYQRNQTELVIIVTTHLVQPAPAGALATPADTFIPPSEADLFLSGKLEAGESAERDRSLQGAGGLAGPYGYVVR